MMAKKEEVDVLEVTPVVIDNGDKTQKVLQKNLLKLTDPNHIQKYVLGSKKNGDPRAIYDVIKDCKKMEKKKKKKKIKKSDYKFLYTVKKKKGKKKHKKGKKRKALDFFKANIKF